jgi:hypothetical protein
MDITREENVKSIVTTTTNIINSNITGRVLIVNPSSVVDCLARTGMT